jgi:hypothetical protein
MEGPFTFIIVLSLFFSAIAGEIERPPTNVMVAPNKSLITARVLGVEKGKFPQAKLELEILDSKPIGKYANLALPGQTIEATIRYYKKGGGLIDLANERNSRNSKAYYLSCGDVIKAVLNFFGDEKGGIWYADDIHVHQRRKITY